MGAKKTRRRIDPHDVNMPELLGDLIRERSLYEVLTSIVEACEFRATHYGEKEDLPDIHPMTRTLWEEESEFFKSAAQAVELVVSNLHSKWEGREPMCADGDLRRIMARQQEVGRDYMRERMKQVASTIRDPDVTSEERRKVIDTFAEEAEGTVWYSRSTGAPDFKIGDNFHKLVLGLGDTALPGEEQEKILTFLEDFVNR